MTVQEILDAARDAHPAFDEYHSPGMGLLRFLSRFQEQLYGRLVQFRPDLVTCTHEVDVPGFDFADGECLPDGFPPDSGGVVFHDEGRDPVPLRLLGADQRFDRPSWPAAYIDGQRIHLLGRDVDWTDVLRLDLRYVPALAPLEDGDSTIGLPGRPLFACVAACEAFLAGRAPGEANPPIRVADYERRATAAELAYFDEVTGRNRVRVSVIPDVW